MALSTQSQDVSQTNSTSAHATDDTMPVPLKDPEAQHKQKFVDSNAGDGTTVFDQHMSGVPLVLCFLACFISMFLIGLDQTIVATILEQVGVQFNAYDQIGWVTTGYMLSMCCLAQTWGKLSIIFGRKYAILMAIVLFEAGSLMCALAQNMDTLIGGRVLAGVGGGGIQTLTFVIMSEVVPINMRPLVFSIFSALIGLSTVSGPLIGGALTERTTWRWCFYINLPMGGLALAALTFFYHPPLPKFTWKEKVKMIDYLGSFLFAAGLVLLLLALSMGGTTYPWRSGAVISMFVLSPLVLAAFSLWNFKYSTSPILPWTIVKVKYVLLPCINLFFTFYSFLALMVYLSTYFEVILGKSALTTGVHFLPMIIGLMISSFSSGILMKKTRHVKLFSIAGGIVAPVGFGLCTLLSVDSKTPALIGFLILPGVSIGLMMQSNIMSVQINSPNEPGAMILGTTFANFSRALGGALGGEIAQTVFNSTLLKKGKSLFYAHPEWFGGVSYTEFSGILSNPSAMSNLSAEAQRGIRICMMDGIHNVFYMCIAVGGMMFLSAVFSSNKRIPKEEDIQTKEEYERQQREKMKESESLEKTEENDGHESLE